MSVSSPPSRLHAPGVLYDDLGVGSLCLPYWAVPSRPVSSAPAFTLTSSGLSRAFPSAFLRVSFTGCSLCQSGVVSPPESDTIFHGLFPPVLGVTRSLPHQPVDGGSAAPLLRSSIGWSDTCGCCCLCCGGLCTLWGHEPSAPVFLSLPASLPLPEGKVEWGGSRVPAGSCASFPEGTSLTEAVFWVHGRRTPD